MSELVRLYKYKSLLSGRRPLSSDQLMQQLEVSRATLKRDLAKLRDQFHLHVRYDRDRGGYFVEHENRGHELPGLWLTPGEITALSALQALISQIQPGLLSGKLDGHGAQLASLARRHGLDAHPSPLRIRVLHTRKRRLTASCLDTLLEATMQRKRVRIVHVHRETRERLEREVSPQKVVMYRDNWYLAAWCHLREGFRCFAVDAIEQAQASPSDSIEMDPAKVDELLTASYGIHCGKPKGWASLRFSPARAASVSIETWHPRQTMRFLSDGSLELRVPYSDDRELMEDVLRFGPDVQVIGPHALRSKVQKMLLAAASGYVEPLL